MLILGNSDEQDVGVGHVTMNFEAELISNDNLIKFTKLFPALSKLNTCMMTIINN
jgi:hypothetical protein